MKIKNKSIYHQHNEIDESIQKNMENVRVRRRRRSILFIIVILVVLSILNILSVAFYQEDSFSIKKHMLIMVGSGAGAGILYRFFNYEIYRKPFMRRFLALSSLAVLAFMIWGPDSIVTSAKGAKGWLDLKITKIQPAEILKIPFIILMANVFTTGEEKKLPFRIIFINSLIVLAVFGIFITMQNDMGTAIHYGAIYIFMLFLTNIDKKIIIRLVSVGITFAVTGSYIIYKYSDKIGGGYKVERIKMFLEGFLSDKYIGNGNIGYQVGQSLLAFGNGGLLGRSYGNGVQKYNYLPEIHTDFIMALFGEEMGFVGVFIVIVLFFTLYNLIVETGVSCKNIFGKYLALGIGGYIISQFLINIFVTLGLLPVFGIPMPIFSYGGSSMITIFAGIGIVLNINKSMFDKK